MKSRIFIKQTFKKLFALVLLTSILSGWFAVSAQTRRAARKLGIGFGANLSDLAIVFLAPPNVSVTLTDANGIVVGKNLAGSTEAEGTFRTILVNNSIQAGTWKLKLESREQTESEIAIAVFQ